MSRIKNLSIIAALAIAGLLLLSFPVFAHGGGNNGYCGNYTYNNNKQNNTQLSKEQTQKIDKIQDKYNDEALPLRQKLNTLRTEAYNYSLNNNTDIDKVKDYRQQIRDLQGKIDDLRLDALAEIDKVVPEDQQDNYNNYFNQCWGDTNGNSNYGMMGNGSYEMMNGNGSYGYGMGNMMRGYGMMGNYGAGNMMGGYGNMHNYNNNQ
ncbi:MAG: periplasmic heavy metal sensor [Ignavibacteriaceae bacterium]